MRGPIYLPHASRPGYSAFAFAFYAARAALLLASLMAGAAALALSPFLAFGG